MRSEMQETVMLGHVESTADLGESRLDVQSDLTHFPCFSVQGAVETPSRPAYTVRTGQAASGHRTPNPQWRGCGGHPSSIRCGLGWGLACVA